MAQQNLLKNVKALNVKMNCHATPLVVFIGIPCHQSDLSVKANTHVARVTNKHNLHFLSFNTRYAMSCR